MKTESTMKIQFIGRLSFAIIVSMLLMLFQTTASSADDTTTGHYVFSYFRGNGEDGLHLAASRDGLTWTALNNDKPFTSPSIGGKLMRDPSIVQEPDGVFHMVWSSGWWDRGFGYAASKDLIHWSDHREIPVNQNVAGAKNTWAPDLFYDTNSRKFAIVFATTVPGRFPETDNDGDHNHRMYWVFTKDFVHFSEPTLAFDPGYNSIDGTLFSANGGLTLIYKRRTARAQAIARGHDTQPGKTMVSRRTTNPAARLGRRSDGVENG